MHHVLCNYLFPLHPSTKKIQIKLVTTRNKNEQQQDAKNNVELQTKWTKTTWKTFEETMRRGRKKVYHGLTRDE